MIDYQRGAKIGGNGAWIYRGWGARMEWALLNFFVNEHLGDGYELILPPHMLNYEALCRRAVPEICGGGLLDRQPDQRRPQIHAAPPRRPALVKPPPRRRSSRWTSCRANTSPIRRATAARRAPTRAEERGMIRGHQFNKVEMVQYTTPEGSDAAFAEMVGKAERFGAGAGAPLPPEQARRGRQLLLHGAHLRYRSLDPEHGHL